MSMSDAKLTNKKQQDSHQGQLVPSMFRSIQGARKPVPIGQIEQLSDIKLAPLGRPLRVHHGGASQEEVNDWDGDQGLEQVEDGKEVSIEGLGFDVVFGQLTDVDPWHEQQGEIACGD